MKNLFRITAVLLAIVMSLSPIASLAGETAQTCLCPRIFIHGLMAQPIVSDKNDKESEVVFPPAAGDIFGTVRAYAPELALALASGGLDAFIDKACDAANDIMGQGYLDKDGNPSGTDGVYFEYPDADDISAGSKLDFNYDWRVDPLESAAQLNDFIDYVLECSGARKVSLSAHSLGGVIALTYISVYGSEKVHAVCFNASAVFGESYTGNLMKGRMRLSGEAFDFFLKYVVDSTEYQYLLSALIDAVYAAGIFDVTVYPANLLLERTEEQVFSQVMAPMFCHWLTIWAMVPDEDIDEAMDYVFGKLKDKDDSAALLEKIENYNTVVRAHKKETLENLNDNACVYVISRYGYSSIPITPSYACLADGNIDTRYSSFGAYTSNYGETLPESYLASAGPEYISPDRTIDASTCMFPEQTWFIRSFKHPDNPESLMDFADMLLMQKDQADVGTFEDYPRFLVYDSENDIISADTSYEKPSAISDIINVLRDIIKLIKNLVSAVKPA